MKLYVESKVTGKRYYLRKSAATRQELVRQIGRPDFRVGNETFSVKDVTAERNFDNTAIAMALGGVIGIVGGAVGVAAGTVIGGIVGNGVDKKETEEIESFNGSKIW